MKNNLAKEKARKILLDNKLYALTDYNDLQRIIESNQFTIIAYKKHTNTEPVSALIKRLNIENEIQKNDSFIYINNNLKLLFINAAVSEKDKCALLRHELGHICDPDFEITNPQNSRIQSEEFANEFAFYAKNPDPGLCLRIFFLKRWKRILAAAAVAALISGCSFMLFPRIFPPAKPVTEDAAAPVVSDRVYYVTSSGKKFHREHCIIIKYRNNVTEIGYGDAVEDGYMPCMLCAPES